MKQEPEVAPEPQVLEEFESTPVPARAQKGGRAFWGMYAGEHAAGTEFMIGPLFLLAGVSLQNLFWGLLLGNFLAVLSWRFVCAPIATKARLTLYCHLEKIAGKDLVKLYNLANGLLFCFLAGAMITVSASAVGIPFHLEMPTLDAIYPNSVSFVVIVLVVGAVISAVAGFGYEAVSRFANIAAPWMVLIFFGCGVVALKQLEVNSWADLQSMWSESIRFAQGGTEETSMGFVEVVLFAWFCNAAMHIGMSDLSVFRYAKKASSGWAATGGMYVGHYMAWLAAAFMLAAQIKLVQSATPVPGPMAYNVVGIGGIICVVVAGWTTANPTIYRAGLAFQAMLPGSTRLSMTLLAGGVATVAAVFPAFAFKLLGFVGLYGTILAPMGAVIFADWYFSRRIGVTQFHAEVAGRGFSKSVFLAWLIPVGISLYFIFAHGVTTWYFVLPSWITCGALFLLFSRLRGHNNSAAKKGVNV
ncbi:purine-cytosine permease family protein [Coraliomargarita sp. W4R53]